MRRCAAFALLVLLAACSHTIPGTPAAAGQSYVVYFQEWSAGLDDAAKQAVQQAADHARQHPGVPIMVAGYAANDNGSDSANVMLSRTRAQQVIDTLRADGVDAGRIHLHAGGATGYQLDPLEARRVSISVGTT